MTPGRMKLWGSWRAGELKKSRILKHFLFVVQTEEYGGETQQSGGGGRVPAGGSEADHREEFCPGDIDEDQVGQIN